MLIEWMNTNPDKKRELISLINKMNIRGKHYFALHIDTRLVGYNEHTKKHYIKSDPIKLAQRALNLQNAAERRQEILDAAEKEQGYVFTLSNGLSGVLQRSGHGQTRYFATITFGDITFQLRLSNRQAFALCERAKKNVRWLKQFFPYEIMYKNKATGKTIIVPHEKRTIAMVAIIEKTSLETACLLKKDGGNTICLEKLKLAALK